MMFALASITHSITIFPASFLTAIEILSLCTSMPIYLMLVIKGCSFLEGLRQAPKPYSVRGALLYCVLFSEVGSDREISVAKKTVSQETSCAVGAPRGMKMWPA